MILLFPFLLLAVAAWFFLSQVKERRGRSQYLDLGLAFVLIITAYGALPGAGLALAYLGVGDLNDVRVSQELDFELVQDVQVMFVLLAMGFASVYSWSRRFPRALAGSRTGRVTLKQVSTLVWVAAALNIGLPLAKFFAGVEGSADYIGTYLELRTYPLIVQQLFSLTSQVAFSSLVAAIVFVVAWRPSMHLRVAAVLIVYVGFATAAGGSRANAFLSLFAYLVAASVYVPTFSMKRIAPLGALALFLFLLAGSLRGANEAGVLGMLQDGEFISVFINAVDLKARLLDGYVTDFGPSFYLTDLVRLVPAQLLDGAKIDPAVWYVETFYPDFHAAGGGLAFGVLAESVVGFGAIEALVRGALLGLLFAVCANRLRPESGNVVRVFVYVWLVVVSYQAFRDTTFSLIVRGLYQIVPVLLILMLVSQRSSPGFLSRARHAR